jgi:mannose-6-phosphate isomerase-like protein (cupin superfamily)
MHITRNQMTVEYKKNLRGGNGTACFTNLAPLETARHIKLFSEVRLEPGASIGCHRHEGESEYYVFVSGTGILNDDGAEYPVSPGDVSVTSGGASHSLTNTGGEDLVFYALIVVD